MFKGYWCEWSALELIDGVLRRRWFADSLDKSVLLPVIPKDLQPEVMCLAHHNPAEGHLGRKKTLSKIQEKFYWFNRRRTVNDWCRNCTVCAT